MAVSPISLTRISHNLRTDFMLESLRDSQRELFLTETRIASGRSFVTASEDPVSAARALDLTQALDRQDQFLSNLRQGDDLLTAADSAFVELNDLMIQASVIANENVNSLTSAEEREAAAEIITNIRQQVQTVANRMVSGRYLFAGRSTTSLPFIDAVGGVAYVGDLTSLSIRADEEQTTPVSVPGNELFGALSIALSRDADLTPALTDSTRLEDVVGYGGAAVETGTLVFNEPDGVGLFRVDLSGARTVGDLVTLINEAAAAAGSGLTATLEADGVVVTPGGSAVSIGDTSAGSTARSLGLLTSTATTDAVGAGALRARLTRLTPVTALAGGAGIDLDGGFVVTNGIRTTVIDLADAETVQDVINAINQADVFVLARINEDGTGIDIFNQVSGTSLSIGENGGTTAADLGIRTMNAATPLSQLNFGRGVHLHEGYDDLQVTAKDGSTVDVNLDGAETIADVIEKINTAATDAGVSVEASFAEVGNGIRLEDSSGGSGALSVSSLNLSAAAADLGLALTASDTETDLVGGDVNPTRTEGIIGALIDLDAALRSDDTRGITAAAERIDGLRHEVIRVQGTVGARSQAMKAKLTQMEDTAVTTAKFLSQVQDLDFAEAATTLQSVMTQLQASLQTSASLMNLSLLNFLR